MRLLLTLALLALAVRPAGGEENEAEKLFHGMEEKVRAAKTLRLRYDLSITGADGTKGEVKGALILGEGDRYRAEGEGKMFGQAVQFTEVCDGANTSFRDPNAPDQNKTEKVPRAVGAYLRGALPREGFFLSTLNMGRGGDLAPDHLHASDFRLAGKEKVGERDTQVVQYTAKEKGGRDALSMKLWLDAKTGLPVKLSITGGKSDWSDLTETYGEFTLDPQVDAKSFELPK